MTELRVGATVHGTAGDIGTIDALVIDPTTTTVTHIVVSHGFLERRRLVPLGSVIEATPEAVEVDLTPEAYEACTVFDEPAFNLPGDDFELPALSYDSGGCFLEPFASPYDGYAFVEYERIPKDEVTMRRGDEVLTNDGAMIGHVDEFLVDPADGHITHIVLRRGHAFHHEDAAVPVAGAKFEEGRVIIGLDLAAAHALELIPVKRHGHITSDSVAEPHTAD